MIVLNNIAKFICLKMKREDPDYVELIEYGLLNFSLIFVYILIILISSLVFNILPEVLLFVIFFMMVRRVAGGYHFNSGFICMGISICISLLVPWIIINFQFTMNYEHLILQMLISIGIILIGPQDHINKRINEKERIHYRKKLDLVLVVYNFITVIMLMQNTKFIFISILFASLICNFFSILLASSKN